MVDRVFHIFIFLVFFFTFNSGYFHVFVKKNIYKHLQANVIHFFVLFSPLFICLLIFHHSLTRFFFLILIFLVKKKQKIEARRRRKNVWPWSDLLAFVKSIPFFCSIRFSYCCLRTIEFMQLFARIRLNKKKNQTIQKTIFTIGSIIHSI